MIEFGAVACDDGVRFTTWAPAARDIALLLRCGGDIRAHRPAQDERGIWHITIPDARCGDRYAYSVDGKGPLPDPASRYQPDGVHGWSAVVDPSSFRWTDQRWRGPDPARAVIYELHVGTFAGDGTFSAVTSRLEYLRELGITVIELMPVADFAGSRNWGYDGVALFAPSRAYGHPDDLRRLVDRAHAVGLAVVIDVVYNHLGPEGAVLPVISPDFLTDRHGRTPWGDAVNLDGPGSDVVRDFLVANAAHWLLEYHVDGLRLDATHELMDTSGRPFVAELVERVRASVDRPLLLYAEDARNLADMVSDPADGGWGLDGVWADDFHHAVRTMTAGDTHGYYADFDGTAQELALTLERGWLYVGQRSRYSGAPRGTDPSRVAMRKSIVCVQNHDQVGNRALGERLHHQVDAATWRAASALLLMAPMTPLLFMGQEWAASSPFQFFTDFEPRLGSAVVEGRRDEFKAFPEFAAAGAEERIPDPQSVATFEASRLRWSERSRPEHATVLALYRALLALRAAHPSLRASDAYRCSASALGQDTVCVTRNGCAGDAAFIVIARLRGAGKVTADAARGAVPILSTEDALFAVDAHPVTFDPRNGAATFSRPGAMVLRR